jgi:CheY-like chemotaxis protein
MPKVLVAEDSPNLARYYEMLLRQWNCETVVEHTGTDAIRRARTLKTSQILSNVVTVIG